MTVFFSQLINGLSLGSIYALIALGYSMVYGIILLLNFAHGDVIMVGAYMSWFVMNQLGLGPVTAVCATIITCTLLGVVIEKIAYTPLRSAPRISLLITAIGVSFFLEYTAELILGSGAKVIPAYYTNQTFRLGKVPLGLTSIITLVVTVLSMLVLTFLVQKTKLGKAMRAVSEDRDAAQLMGIYVFATSSESLAICSALGFAAVISLTKCDVHLVSLLMRPLKKLGVFLLPSCMIVTSVIATAIPSMAGLSAAVGPTMIPIMIRSGFKPAIAAAAVGGCMMPAY